MHLSMDIGIEIGIDIGKRHRIQMSKKYWQM